MGAKLISWSFENFIKEILTKLENAFNPIKLPHVAEGKKRSTIGNNAFCAFLRDY